jgi:hypothetical protein
MNVAGVWFIAWLHLSIIAHSLALACLIALVLAGPLRGPWSYSGHLKQHGIGGAA